MSRPSRLALSRLLLAALLATAGALHAQAAPTPAPRSGDAWVDGRLQDIGAYAATYRDAFVDELVRYHRAPRELVVELLARPGWTPGDVYFACSLAMQSGRPCRSVADLHAADADRDWASIARDLGAAPGTPAYRELKRGIVATYDRWARPVAVDAELAPLFPNRPHATAAHARPAAEATRPAERP